jgi:hypothetical protein
LDGTFFINSAIHEILVWVTATHPVNRANQTHEVPHTGIFMIPVFEAILGDFMDVVTSNDSPRLLMYIFLGAM